MTGEAPAKPSVHGFLDRETGAMSYVVRDPGSDAAAIIDPVLGYDPDTNTICTASMDMLIDFIAERKLAVSWILETHVHADHLSAASVLRGRLGARIGIGERVTQVQEHFSAIFGASAEFRTDGSQFDKLFADGAPIHIGGLDGYVMHTPGHTPSCVTYVFGDAAFIGDTLFMPDLGSARCDFPGGNARILYQSIQRLYRLPPSTRLFLCHDYGTPSRDHPVWEASVAQQRQSNIHARDGIGEDEFVGVREERDKSLKLPKLFDESLRMNIIGRDGAEKVRCLVENQRKRKMRPRVAGGNL